MFKKCQENVSANLRHSNNNNNPYVLATALSDSDLASKPTPNKKPKSK